MPLRGNPGHINETLIVVDYFDSVSSCMTSRKLSRETCERGWKIAKSKHPGFAEGFGSLGVCEDIYGTGNCRKFRSKLRTFYSPNPVGFIVCGIEPQGCTKEVWAPVYRSDQGDVTGGGGGYIGPSVVPSERFTVSGVFTRPPVI